MVTEKFFQSAESLLLALSTEIELLLRQAICDRGQASFLVSGGSSPEPLYHALSIKPLEWEKVTVALVDERWVAPSNSASNEAFIQRSLLQNKAVAASFVGMKNSAESIELGLSDCEDGYQQMASPWDVLILGMGTDGHTASLFPYALGLEAAMDDSQTALCAAITASQSTVTGTHTKRISLSLNGIVNARQIILFISGDSKLSIYQQALKSTANIMQLPVAAVLQQKQTPVAVYWAP